MNFIKIGGILYNINMVKDLARDHNALGRCCGNSGNIDIDSDLEDKIKDKVFIHEVIEALNFEYELNLEHNKISILAMSLHQVLVDNMTIFHNIVERGKINEKLHRVQDNQSKTDDIR